MARIISTMLSKNYLYDVSKNMSNLQTLQNQLSTGKEISKPSDDPYKASRIIKMYADIGANEQYNDNITDASNFLDVTDTSLTQMSNLLSRVRELLVSAGNAAYGSEQLKSIQDEMSAKVNQLAQILNTNFDGKYVFGGTKVDSKPVTVVDGRLEFANASGNSIIMYLDANGDVVENPITNNKKYESNQQIYINSNNEVTTSKLEKDGETPTKAVISIDNLYMSDDGSVTAGKNPDGSGSHVIFKENLYYDSYGNVSTKSVSVNSEIIKTDKELYYDKDGYVTTEATGNKLVDSSFTLYSDKDGNIRVNPDRSISDSKFGESNPELKVVDSNSTFYSDIKGKVVNYSEKENTKFDSSKDKLYYNNEKNLTVLSKYKDGDKEIENTAITDTDRISVNKNNILVTGDTAYDEIKLADGLFKDADGNIVITKQTDGVDNTEIKSGEKIYLDGNKITLDKGTDNTNNEVVFGDGLYYDKDKNITVDAARPNTLLGSDQTIYIDDDGFVTSEKTNRVFNFISDSLYVDDSGNVKAMMKDGNQSSNPDLTPVPTGTYLYIDESGMITTKSTTDNSRIPDDVELYSDASGKLTEESKVDNVKLSLDDIKNYNNKYNELSSKLKQEDLSDEDKEKINNEMSMIQKVLKSDQAIQLSQIGSDMKIEISQGVTVNYNQTAIDILEFTDNETGKTINVSDLFNDIINNLNSEDGKSKLTGENLSNLDKVISNVLSKSSQVGALQNRMEAAKTQNESDNTNLTAILSNVEDIDFTEKMIDFSTLMTVYKASLQISANILPKTIMDYL